MPRVRVCEALPATGLTIEGSVAFGDEAIAVRGQLIDAFRDLGFGEVPSRFGKLSTTLSEGDRVVQRLDTQLLLRRLQTAIEPLPRWAKVAIREIKRMQAFPNGWDSYDAEPPNDCAVKSAIESIVELSKVGLRPTKVGASVEGGVCIAFREGAKYADVECFNTSELLTVTSSNRDEAIVAEHSRDDQGVREAVRRIRSFMVC